MLTIGEGVRARRRPAPETPAIREVCLIGTPSRRYRHLASLSLPKDWGLGTQDWGLKPKSPALSAVRQPEESAANLR